MEKKKKWNVNTKGQKRNEILLNEIMSGFLIFTDKNKEKNAVRDAYNILNDKLEEIYPMLKNEQNETDNNPNTNNDNNTTDNIDKELKSLQNKKKYFFNFNTNCKGVVFIKVDKEYTNIISPLTIVSNIFEEINESKETISKAISKFIPIEYAFKAKFDIFKEKSKELITKYFINESNDKISWKVEIRIRNNNSINKNEYMDYIISLIDKEKFYVNYKLPHYTVLIEITNDLCCLSVLQKYAEFKCYNIQNYVKTEEERENERQRLIQMQNKKIKKDNTDNNNNNENKDNNNNIDNDNENDNDEEIDII